MALLDGRAVVVTGAGRGLGSAFARACAEHGAAVVVNDVDAAEADAVVQEIVDAGGRAVVSHHSVADWAQAGELIELCVASFGHVDGLVNNAVVYPYFGDPVGEEEATIRSAIEVNVMGAMFCGTHAMRRMVDQRRGSIVNLTSRAMQGIPGGATYSAAKGALASLTYGWALEMAKHDVRVNALAPAAMTRGHQAAGATGSFVRNDAVEPDRIAGAVVYLLSDLAGHLNGQVLALIGTKLGIVRPPAVLPIGERERWDVASIADALDGSVLQPVGLPEAVDVSPSAGSASP